MAAVTIILDGIWGRPWRFERLRRSLEQRGAEARIFRYDATGMTRFELLGERLAQEVRSVGRPVNLVGFSMGGIVVRAARWVDPQLPVERAVFLNSPMSGSWLAYALGLAAVKQLRPNSAFLKQLEECPWDIPTLAVWCVGDAIILPNSSANWQKATESMRSLVPAHIWPIYSRRIHDRIGEFLDGTVMAEPPRGRRPTASHDSRTGPSSTYKGTAI